MNREKITALHSRYNPQAEAERYIASLSLNEKIRFFILIEPGLGYMIAPLKKRIPTAKIIALHAEEDHSNNHLVQAVTDHPDAQWYPGRGITIRDFLENEIPDSQAEEIRILEWRPALAVYGSSYLALVEQTVEFIKQMDANTRTFKALGGKWFKNFFKNLSIIRKVFRPVTLSMPLLVSGAGPGLEDSIPLIREKKLNGSLFILAVSSSVAALEAEGIAPDMVISTDGGNWAAFHLFECLRGKPLSGDTPGNTRPCPLAAAMTAALPSQCTDLPVLPISDGSLWQTLILKGLNIPFVVLPQRGTVSAAALDLAFALTSGDIFITGLDLANRDIRSHARPYSLDRFIDEKKSRLNPLYSQTYRRSSLLKAGGSYGIYASWFEKQLSSYPRRLFSLRGNNPLFKSLESSPSAMLSETKTTKESPVQFETFNLEFNGNPSQEAYSILEKALKDPVLSVTLEKELGPIVSQGGGSLSHG